MIKAISEPEIKAIIETLNDGPPDMRIVKASGEKGLIYQLKRSVYNGGKKDVIRGEFRLYGTEATMVEIFDSAEDPDNVPESYVDHYKSGEKLYKRITAEYRVGYVKSRGISNASEFFDELDSFKRQKKIYNYPEVIERNCRGGKEYILRDVIDQYDINLGNIEGRIKHLYRKGKKLMRIRVSLDTELNPEKQDIAGKSMGHKWVR